jgi:hypothetical protein
MYPDALLPGFVRDCALTMNLRSWLGLLEWDRLPLLCDRHWFGHDPVPLAAYLGAYLVKIDQGLPTMSGLHRFLEQHPALVWALGFPLRPDRDCRHGFDVAGSLPSQRQFSRRLSQLPNNVLQLLLDEQVAELQRQLPATFGQTISLDTKAILAWVKENNPKEYIKEGRYDKARQPAGDPDCKVGCKRKHNLHLTTPAKEGEAASTVRLGIGEFHWGYASGIVVAKVPGWGEFVLAELTQTFDKGDATFFFPLMEQVERRLGFRPRYGALDAAYDAFYVYDYFHDPEHDGFAAVPFSHKGGNALRHFDENGLPLCAAALSMPCKFTYLDRTSTIIPYRRAKYLCPLLYPEANGQTCPIDHPNWPKGGCTTSIAATPGARIRHQLDRDSAAYHAVYDQRTAAERIFSQALALGIERPKLRHQAAIANQNTLIYLLINLRSMQRLLAKQAKTNI